MNVPFELLMATAAVGAVDVLYFHLYRFRLYAQPGSAAEEVTHLARHVLFVGMLAALLVRPPGARALVIGLFALDLLNNAVDVLLERSSRAPLGGLPPAEALLHILASVLSGAFAAAFWFAPDAPLTDAQLGRGAVTIALGAGLFLAEAALFVRAVGAQSANSVNAWSPIARRGTANDSAA